MIESFERPNAVDHVVPVVSPKTERSVKQGEHCQTATGCQGLHNFRITNGVVMEIQEREASQIGPKG